MNDAPWRPLVELLEEFEYFPERSASEHPLKMALGVLLCCAGLVVFALNELWPAALERWLPELAALPLSVVAIVAGAVYAVRSLPRHRFAQFQRLIARHIWVIATAVQLVLTATAVFLALVMVLAEATDEADLEDQIAFGLIIAATSVVVFIVGGSQLQVGITAMRSRLRAGATARWLDTISLAALFTFPVVLASRTELDWAAAAVPAVLALIGSHYQRATAFDRTVQSLMQSFESIRRSGLTAAAEGSTARLYAAMRDLHIDLAQRPRVLGSPLRASSLEALCAVADARGTGRESPEWSAASPERTAAARRVWAMAERDFALGAAQVFDAQLQQIDPSLAPPGGRAPKDLRAILAASALPRPSREAVAVLARPRPRRLRALGGARRPRTARSTWRSAARDPRRR